MDESEIRRLKEEIRLRTVNRRII